MSSLCHFVFICFLEFSLRQMMCGVASAADGSVCVRGVHWDSEEISTCSVTATEQSSAATQSSWKLCATNFTSTTLAHFGSSVSPQLFCQPVLNVQKIHCTGFACPPRLWQLVKPVAPDKKHVLVLQTPLSMTPATHCWARLHIKYSLKDIAVQSQRTRDFLYS